METRTFILWMAICLFSGLPAVQAQRSNVSAGGEGQGTGGTISFSVGLPDFYYMFAEGVGSLQFGVQHAFFGALPPDIPEYLDIENLTLSGDDIYCFNAYQTITTGGDGKVFIVEPDAFAELIAGLNIRMLYGTAVISGGGLHARITTDGSFCTPDKGMITMAPLADTGDEAEGEIPAFPGEKTDIMGQHALLRAYPNPTRGIFTLEMVGAVIPETPEMTVEVYGLRGERIIRESLASDQPHVFSLEGNQPGIYIIRVVIGGSQWITRIIKR